MNDEFKIYKHISILLEYIFSFYCHLRLTTRAIFPLISLTIASFLNPVDKGYHNFIDLNGILFQPLSSRTTDSNFENLASFKNIL